MGMQGGIREEIQPERERVKKHHHCGQGTSSQRTETLETGPGSPGAKLGQLVWQPPGAGLTLGDA